MEKTVSPELKVTMLGELASRLAPSHYPDKGMVPLSPLRLESYLENPRASASDSVLFEAYLENRLVAYRTLLPDAFRDDQGRVQRFAWLSGNYVDTDYRRQGISTRLLQLAEKQWDGRLMFTNYAPASKALYDRTGNFKLLAERPGSRFYLRSAAEELLFGRLGLEGTRENPGDKTLRGITGGLLRSGDLLLNRVRKKKLDRYQTEEGNCFLEHMTEFDPGLRELTGKVQKQTLFGRDTLTFNWILEHPWVTDKLVDPIPYPFSYRASLFRNILVRMTMPGGSAPALLWMVIHNRKMTVPYVLTEDPGYYPSMAGLVIRTMIQHGSAYTTIRHPELHRAMMERKKWFLAVRPMPQFLFVHKDIEPLVPPERMIQDGDGDVVFSG